MNKVESALQRTTDTKALVIGSDALPRSAEMFKELFPGKRAIIVADKITYPLAGEAVKNYFDAAGIAQYLRRRYRFFHRSDGFPASD